MIQEKDDGFRGLVSFDQYLNPEPKRQGKEVHTGSYRAKREPESQHAIYGVPPAVEKFQFQWVPEFKEIRRK